MTPGWRLPNLSDVFLSCCETSLGLTQITDDVLTLSSGFLCAGARNVVSTLWSVEDLATALFSICYHRYRQQGSCRSSALQQAQEELRSLSGQTLATVYQPQLTLLLDGKFQQAEKARKEAKANRDKETKGTQAYLKWDEEYKRHTKAAERIRKTKNRLNALCQESFPFSHPFYWAAFTCSGLR
jgi:CHAT domain-containing protein